MTAGPRRILFCTLGYEPGPVGGAERQARLQARELARRGYAVEVVSPRAGSRRSERVDGVIVRRLPRFDRRPFRTVSYLPVLFVWLVANLRRFDLVHVHLANLQADVVGLVARWSNVPMYVKLAAGGPRGEIGRMRPLAWLTRFSGIRGARVVQAISDEIAADVRAIGVADSRVIRVPNGLDTSVFCPSTPIERKEIRRSLDLPLDAVLVLFAGRLARYKGILDLLHVWASIPVRSNELLVVVGEDALDAPIGTLPPVPATTLRPWSQDIARYMRACDIFVLPSYAEGMSNALLEAMACGMAVVSTRVGAAPEMIVDRENGRLIAPGSHDELRDVLVSLLAEPDERGRLSERASATIASRYAITRVVDAIEDGYALAMEPA